MDKNMKKEIRKILNKKSASSGRIASTSKIAERVKVTEQTVGEVESVRKVISDTLFVRGNIAVDMKNFSLLSVTSPKELL